MLPDAPSFPSAPGISLDAGAIRRFVGQLEQAETRRAPIPRLTQEVPTLAPDVAYLIQAVWAARRARRAGRPVGFKMGLTTEAKQRQMGLSTPIYGILFEGDRIVEGADARRDDLVQPRVEPEIAYVLGRELRGPDVDRAAVLDATAAIHPALEVIDSRYRGFAADLPSMIADNCFSGRFLLASSRRAATSVDSAAVAVTLEKNGESVGSGTGAAVLGHPAASVALLANLLATVGEALPAGSIVLTGGIVPAVTVSAGDRVAARFSGLGEIELRFV